MIRIGPRRVIDWVNQKMKDYRGIPEYFRRYGGEPCGTCDPDGTRFTLEGSIPS